LGRTQGNGPIDAATMVANFMGNGAAPSNNGANSSVGVEDNIPASGAGTNNNNNNRRNESPGMAVVARQFLKNLLGGLGGGAGAAGGAGLLGGLGGGAGAAGGAGLLGGLGGGGQGTASAAATEVNVAATRGEGATSGLPTCGDDGSIEMVFHQVSFRLSSAHGIVSRELTEDGRSTRTAPALSRRRWTPPRAGQKSPRSRQQRSRRTCPALASRD
jgi:hypothetical protein